MLLVGIAYLLGLAAFIVLVGALRAQPDTAANRRLRLFFILNILWLVLSLGGTLAQDPALTTLLLRISGLLCVLSGLLITSFIFHIGYQRAGRIMRYLVFITVMGALGYVSWYTAQWMGVVKPLPSRLEFVFNLVPMGHWGVNLWLMHGLVAGMDNRRDGQQRAMMLFYGTMLFVVLLGLILAFRMMFFGSLSSMYPLMPFFSVLWVPTILVAVFRYDFLGVDMGQVVKEIFRNARDGILIIGIDGRIREANRAAHGLLALSPDAIDRPFRELLPGGDRNGEDAFEVFQMRGENRGQLEISISPIARGGRSLGSLVLIRDITDQKAADEILRRTNDAFEEEIQERMDELVQLEEMEAVGAMAGSIAHDFNNLLAAILGFSSAAYQDLPVESSARKDVERILSAARRARDTVDQLLAFSRPNPIKRGVVDVAEMLESTLHLVWASIPSSVTLHSRSSVDDVYVMGSQVDLSQAVMNLCTNAVQSLVSIGGGEMEVEVAPGASEYGDGYVGRTVDGDYSVEIVVRDRGEGMGEEIRVLACEPFFTTREDAIGFGLPTALRIAKDHQGGLFLRSREGGGSEVGLVLPRMAVRDSIMPEGMGQFTGGEHILLVDDDARLLRMGTRLLGTLGYRVSVFEDPRAALEAFRRTPGVFDMVITDLRMPHMDGIRLAREIFEERPDIPILLISGNVSNDEMQLAREEGVRGLAKKPFVVDDLARQIRDLFDDEASVSFPG